MKAAQKLLWIDSGAAALAGVGVVAFSGWLSRLHGLPRELLLFIGAVNLVYAAYSFSLAVRAERPMLLIKLLVCGNASWAVICLVLATAYLSQATVFGMAHLVGEGIFVGGLAAIEWNQRHILLANASPRSIASIKGSL
jgi:hypothetical protein